MSLLRLYQGKQGIHGQLVDCRQVLGQLDWDAHRIQALGLDPAALLPEG